MVLFEWILALLLGAVVLSALARRLKVPYPVLLAVSGATISLLPRAPHLRLEPDVALALLVAPVLLDAAYDTSVRDLKAAWAPLANLVFFAVASTTIATALVARHFVPQLSWAAAIALGAVVSPPDAAAAIAVLKQVRMPHRLVTVIAGESLLNDATALLVYRVAVTAALAGSFSARHALTSLGLAALSLLVGPVLARLFLGVIARFRDVTSSIVLQFVSTFGVWILASRLGLSPILTVVTYAVFIARSAPARVPAAIRIPSYAVWDTVVFIANVLAFALVGLQIGPIWGALPGPERWQYVGVAGLVLLTALGVRILSVMQYIVVARWNYRRRSRRGLPVDWRPTVFTGLIVSWCGMRGIVTLAAALALPASTSGAAFPNRELIVFTAYVVVLGTLVLQGLTLRPLLERLPLPKDDLVEREIMLGHAAMFRAAYREMERDDSDVARELRLELSRILSALADGQPQSSFQFPVDEARGKALRAAREAVLAMRGRGEIGDDAFHRLEEELDRGEYGLPSAPGS